jgi:signal transduction histidine kinase
VNVEPGAPTVGQGATTGTAAAEPVRISRSRSLAQNMPSWLGSIRFRIAAIYSLLLFGLAALGVGALYAIYAHDLDSQPVSKTYVLQVVTPDGVVIEDTRVPVQLENLERLVNQRAIDTLRNRAFLLLALLFLASLLVGWFVSGLVLAPIERITNVARQIQATDLSRRIALGGPNDELRALADTFDGMLARLEEAFEAQRRFIQDASHELRNPLAVMRTNIDVALADPDATTEDLRHTAVVVGRTTERMSRLVDDLLVYARHGLPDEQWEEVELASIVSETVDEFRAPAEARSLRLIAHSAPGVAVSADRTELKQALANLVGNAVRLAPAGTTVVVASGTDDRWAFLSVADEGPGLPEEQLESVFERFWRAPGQPLPDGERRSGLGLTIVKEIAERHGGRAAVASRDGVGSTFVLWLPALSGRFTDAPVGSSS